MNASAPAVPTQSSSTQSRKPFVVPKVEKPQYDLQALKKQVGAAPFLQRIQFDEDGYSACPFHNGDSNKSFHLVEKPDGAFVATCFSECQTTFDAIDFVKKFDGVKTGTAIQTLRQIVEADVKAPHPLPLRKQEPALPMTAEKWADSGRAVTDADVEKLSASRPHSLTPTAKTLNEMGFRIGNDRFLICPYRLGNTFYTIKGRNIESKEFIQENSVSQKGLFNIDAVKAGDDVYVVESELDAAVLHENGYTAVSVISATQKQIEHEVLKKLTTAKRIFLVGDQDGAGQVCMDNIAKLLPPEKLFRISFLDHKDVGELALACKGGLGTFADTFENLKTDAMASWVVKNIPFASDIPDDPVQWVIDRLLPCGNVLMLSGKYGAMKSLIGLTLASGLARGTEVLGRKVSQKTPVLYIDRENPKEEIGLRRSKLGIPKKAIYYWGDWLERNPTPSLDDPRLDEFAAREKGVIIFDSLTDWLQGINENDASEMTPIMYRFRQLARLGAGVIVLHHNNKYGDVARGSTAIPAGTDMSVKVTKTGDGVIQLREDRFRACGTWEMDIRIDFQAENGTRYKATVLRDESPSERHKQEVNDELTTMEQIIAENPGLTQRKLFPLAAQRGIGRPTCQALLRKGSAEHRWKVEEEQGKHRKTFRYYPIQASF